MPPPIAMYSKILVGEPKKRASTMWRVVRRHVDVARLQQARTVGLRHAADAAHARLEAMALHLGIELRLVRAVADDQELRVGCAAQIRGIAAASTSMPCHPPKVPVKPITRSRSVKPRLGSDRALAPRAPPARSCPGRRRWG